MSPKTMKQDFLESLGSPADIDRELRKFRKSAKVLSSHHKRLIDEYEKKWVAIYEGKASASGKTLKQVLKNVDKKGIPRDSIILRFIDRNKLLAYMYGLQKAQIENAIAWEKRIQKTQARQ